MFTGTFHRKTHRWISHLPHQTFVQSNTIINWLQWALVSPDTVGWSRGGGTRVVNIEYSYDPLHEDLQNAPVTHAWGWDQDRWHYHGNAVIGQIIATDNEYGVTGAAPDAEVLVIAPYPEENYYNVAAAIVASLDFLVIGDVVLIEQQTSAFDGYCPMEYVPSVFDAIQWLVAEDINVVEPSANGSQDLDAERWEGWFDLTVQDSWCHYGWRILWDG